MRNAIENLYIGIIKACGFRNAPRLEFRSLGGAEARYEYLVAGRGLSARTIDQAIVADVAALKKYDIETTGKILCHEFAHWICRWQCVASDQTRDGQRHGVRFLAVWLYLLRLCGGNDAVLDNAAAWHVERYDLTSDEAARALGAARTADSTSKAIDLATPSPQPRNLALFWLRMTGWSALGLAAINLIYESHGTALVSATMACACSYLIFKFKRTGAIGALA